MPARTVVVASENPVKRNATLRGFQQMFPAESFVIESAAVSSGVGDQPTSEQVTRLGAVNRMRAVRQHNPRVDFAVAIEGGIEIVDGSMMGFAWIVIESAGTIGRGRSGSFMLPPRVQQLVEEGNELGTANDIFFSQHNSKQQGGAIGLLTDDVIDREQLYQHAVVLALVPFKRRDLFVTQASGGCQPPDRRAV